MRISRRHIRRHLPLWCVLREVSGVHRVDSLLDLLSLQHLTLCKGTACPLLRHWLTTGTLRIGDLLLYLLNKLLILLLLRLFLRLISILL